MQDSLESTIRRLVKEAVKEALAEVRDARECMANCNGCRAPIVTRQGHEVAEPDELLVSSHEAKKMLSVSEATLARLTQSGAIPSMKIGHLRRYSVVALKHWISSSASPSLPQGTGDDGKVPKAEAKLDSQPSKKSMKASQRQPPFDSTKLPLSRTTGDTGNHQSNPFRKLLSEIGVKYSDIHPITNGDIQRIAEVDTATCHGWLYLNRPLPADALAKLRNHFLMVTKKN